MSKRVYKFCDTRTFHASHTWGITPGEYFCPGMKYDPVNHPAHYTSHPSGVECIEITRHMSFNLGNVVKYLWRDGIKNEITSVEDLEKAAWYLNDEIKRRKTGHVTIVNHEDTDGEDQTN